jgi:hypothetical protein
MAMNGRFMAGDVHDVNGRFGASESQSASSSMCPKGSVTVVLTGTEGTESNDS